MAVDGKVALILILIVAEVEKKKKKKKTAVLRGDPFERILGGVGRVHISPSPRSPRDATTVNAGAVRGRTGGSR